MWQHRSTTERLDGIEKFFERLFGRPDDDKPRHSVDPVIHFLQQMEKRLMSVLDDLKAAIDDLATELADNNAEIETLLTKITTPGTSDADIAAAVQSIRDLTKANKDEVAKAKAAVP